jgi:hypothetical protein
MIGTDRGLLGHRFTSDCECGKKRVGSDNEKAIENLTERDDRVHEIRSVQTTCPRPRPTTPSGDVQKARYIVTIESRTECAFFQTAVMNFSSGIDIIFISNTLDSPLRLEGSEMSWSSANVQQIRFPVCANALRTFAIAGFPYL